MPLPTYSFASLVTQAITAISSQTTKISNFSSGSVALAITQGFASVALLIQQLILQMTSLTRLATSTGSDVDSFVADYGLSRLAASPARVSLTLTRTSSGTQLLVSLASSNTVQTIQSQVQFILVPDTGQAAWNAGLNSYQFNVGQTSITATAQAVVAGSAGNVATGTLTQIVAGFVGVSTVTNAAQASGGANQESDAALRARFVLYLQSLRTADDGAIEFAIESVQTGLTFQLIEYQDFLGNPVPSHFVAVVDDGTGAIPISTLTAVSVTINAVRAAGVTFEVHAPTNEVITVSVHIVAAAGFVTSSVQAAVTTSVTNYINGLGVGVSVPLAGVANAIQTTPGVFSYINLLLNAVDADFAITQTQLARAGTVSFT